MSCFFIPMKCRFEGRINITAYELANVAIKENRPIDYNWLDYIKRTYTDKELLEWAKDVIFCFTSGNESKSLITRAANVLIKEIF